jgi:hypothetical protein
MERVDDPSVELTRLSDHEVATLAGPDEVQVTSGDRERLQGRPQPVSR